MTTAALCKYLTAGEIVETFPAQEVATKPSRDMCAWAHYHGMAADPLSLLPPWAQRAVLGGHQVKPDQDCPRCLYFTTGPPVE